MPSGTSTLILSYNNITTLHKNDFEKLHNCSRLEIAHMISKIEKETFNGLNVLNILDLSYNRISSLIEGSLLGMSRLQSLLLEANRLSHRELGLITELTKLPILRHISLKKNGINYLKPMIFSNITQLETLDLRQNYVKKKLTPDTYKSLQLGIIVGLSFAAGILLLLSLSILT